jgi:hypothetical protein
MGLGHRHGPWARITDRDWLLTGDRTLEGVLLKLHKTRPQTRAMGLGHRHGPWAWVTDRAWLLAEHQTLEGVLLKLHKARPQTWAMGPGHRQGLAACGGPNTGGYLTAAVAGKNDRGALSVYRHFPTSAPSFLQLFTFMSNRVFNTCFNRRMASPGMLRRVALVTTDVSDELSASIIRVQ